MENITPDESVPSVRDLKIMDEAMNGTTRHFKAIIAKNQIARELKDFTKGEPLSVAVITRCLEAIENYTGEGNQPSVKNILSSDQKI